ncbi:Putative flavin-binding monooxygenase involved in arsenic resistance [Blastococcus saxobsidens DD2]|uniref:Putative flavin-binding monooxygenase involved in arsenic resistance n=1 Tax=Blastococcus saxobsidens (strain DD2) TaxID=1146883 RepID=H6RJJ7_BLASD|nr:Putative flavin-binding monooxygenase involved in arsenic resistance [Blastococcus saxobsidens DD2]
MPEYDVIVIGAGQAGLAAGHALRTTGLSFTLLEADEQPRGSWAPPTTRSPCSPRPGTAPCPVCRSPATRRGIRTATRPPPTCGSTPTTSHFRSSPAPESQQSAGTPMVSSLS